MNLLYVEDNPNTAAATKVMLELRGFRVETAGTVEESVQMLSSNTYDLLVSDISLPDGTGHDILSRAPRPIPAIAVTGHTGEEDRAEASHSGFREYVTKPFKIDELIAAIHRATVTRA